MTIITNYRKCERRRAGAQLRGDMDLETWGGAGAGRGLAKRIVESAVMGFREKN